MRRDLRRVFLFEKRLNMYQDVFQDRLGDRDPHADSSFFNSIFSRSNKGLCSCENVNEMPVFPISGHVKLFTASVHMDSRRAIISFFFEAFQAD